MVRRSGGSVLILFMVNSLLGGCSGGRTEGQCATPTLELTPTTVTPGSPVTIQLKGAIFCEGELAIPTNRGVVSISLAETEAFPTSEPFHSPSPAASAWAQVVIPSEPTTISPPAVAVIPMNLKPGKYFAYVTDNFFISSGPIAVQSG